MDTVMDIINAVLSARISNVLVAASIVFLLLAVFGGLKGKFVIGKMWRYVSLGASGVFLIVALFYPWINAPKMKMGPKRSGQITFAEPVKRSEIKLTIGKKILKDFRLSEDGKTVFFNRPEGVKKGKVKLTLNDTFVPLKGRTVFGDGVN